MDIAANMSFDHPLVAAFESTKGGFFLASANGSILRANEALRTLLGDVDPCGRLLSDLVHEDDRADLGEALHQFDAGERDRFGGEVRMVRDGADPIWVELGITAIPDTATEERLLIGQVRDIRIRRELEEALRASEQLFRAAFDDAAVGMLLVSSDGTILRANAALSSLVDYEEDELEGLCVFELTHPDDRAESEAALPKLRDGELGHFSVEKRYLRKNGKPVWVEVAVAPVRMTTDEPPYFVTQVVDLTARRKAEQKFRMVFDAAGIGISTGADGMLTETNAAYQRLIGYTGDELSRMHFSEITHPDDLEVDDEARAELTAGEKSSFTVEKRYIRRDGEILWVRVTVTMAPDGSFGIGLIEDVTERRQLLARTVETAENERMSLAADLHDGPIQHLTAAAFRLDLLVSKLERDGATETAAIAGRVRDEVAAEMTSLRKMMIELRPPVMDERGLETAIGDTVDAIFDGTETDYAISSNLNGDRLAPEFDTAIYRVIREAATNVRRHALAGHALIGLDARADTIDVTVTDDGVGFDTSRDANGHYGLVTMKERAESLGGSFQILSSPGAGTRLRASFPRRLSNSVR
jgi:PAS domain S-box-containing protein